MSCKRKVQAWKEVKIHIDTLSKQELIMLEDSIKECITQKLIKLDILLKNVNTYYANGILLINDRYGVLTDIEQIISAFGMNIKKINCNLKGKNYIITDELIELASMLNCENVIESKTTQVSDEILAIILENYIQQKESNLKEILQKIRRTGSYDITQKELIEETWEDGRLLSSQTIEKHSEEKTVKSLLEGFAKKAQNTVNSNNKHMQEGTTELLCSRAKQMGYTVKKEKQGEEIQLVLVRLG